LVVVMTDTERAVVCNVRRSNSVEDRCRLLLWRRRRKLLAPLWNGGRVKDGLADGLAKLVVCLVRLGRRVRVFLVRHLVAVVLVQLFLYGRVDGDVVVLVVILVVVDVRMLEVVLGVRRLLLLLLLRVRLGVRLLLMLLLLLVPGVLVKQVLVGCLPGGRLPLNLLVRGQL
jgi:hypothetical protein